MISHQWGRTSFPVIRQKELVQMSFFKTPRFFAHGKSQDLTPMFYAEAMDWYVEDLGGDQAR